MVVIASAGYPMAGYFSSGTGSTLGVARSKTWGTAIRTGEFENVEVCDSLRRSRRSSRGLVWEEKLLRGNDTAPRGKGKTREKTSRRSKIPARHTDKRTQNKVGPVIGAPKRLAIGNFKGPSYLNVPNKETKQPYRLASPSYRARVAGWRPVTSSS